MKSESHFDKHIWNAVEMAFQGRFLSCPVAPALIMYQRFVG